VTSAPATSPRSRAASRLGRSTDYAQLCSLVRDAGLLQRRPGRYGARIAATVAFYAATWAVIVWLGNSWWQLLAAAVLGVAVTQITFLGHDAGHLQIFTSRRANDRFAQLISVITGLSFGWWIGKHNRHHANPNKEDHDPDIGDGVFAFTTTQIAARTGGVGRVIAARQAWLFFPLLAFEGYNLRMASLLSLRPGAQRSTRGGNRAVELGIWITHLTVYCTGLLLIMSPLTALVFVAIHQGVWGFYMGCSFAPNHKGMPVIAADDNVDFLRRQVLTSRNVRGGVFTDLLLGGLNYQIEHHLFPSMPRANQRRAQQLVRSYCSTHNIAYCETTLPGSYIAALRHLNTLGAPLRRSTAATATGDRLGPEAPKN
jgi:fatty acid desaturase